jgi:hypothetical protein
MFLKKDGTQIQFLIHVFFFSKGELLGMIPTVVPTPKKKKKNVESSVRNLWSIEPDLELGLELT